MSIKVMIVDDHNMVSEVLSALLTRETDMEVVAVAQNGREAIPLAREFRPDIIVMDISMPEMNGLEACRVHPENERFQDTGKGDSQREGKQRIPRPYNYRDSLEGLH
jgi:YesN/AraC family two-component response regulator